MIDPDFAVLMVFFGGLMTGAGVTMVVVGLRKVLRRP